MTVEASIETIWGLRQGAVLSGKYRIGATLGVGGMGVVVSAHHVQLDERVAIKFLLPKGLMNPETVERFSREARLAVKIKSAHVARVLDVAATELGAPYIVMEYLEGQDLATWAQQNQPSHEQLVDLMLQACEGLAEAHRLGIVHRDVKPGNLFIVRGSDGCPEVKILDFGISKVSSESPSESITRASVLMGSPPYISPEQLRSARDVGPQTDIWALGAVLYELLAGSPPFSAGSLPDLCLQVTTRPPPALREQHPEVPPQLERVILKCLEKDPEHRYGSVARLAADLAEFASPRARLSLERLAGIQGGGSVVEPTGSEEGHGPPSAVSLAPHSSWRGSSADWRTSLFTVLMPGSILLGLSAFAGFIVMDRGASVPEHPALVTRAQGARSGDTPEQGPGSAARGSGTKESRDAPSSSAAPAPIALSALPVDLESLPKARPELAGGGGVRSPGDPLLPAAREPSTAGPGGGQDGPPENAAALGVIAANAIPAASVLVDGVPRGKTPLRIQVPAGFHWLTFITSEGKRQRVGIVVESGGTAHAAVSLR